jgi:hypothetical protein
MLFDLAQEEDGSWDFISLPFFEVSSVQMTGAGEAPLTLALYDKSGNESTVYQISVKSGDEIDLAGLS